MKIRLLCLTVLISLFFTVAIGADDFVEIAFRIGDSEVTVNGQSVSTVMPYLENGTTLVPLRLISESFGAEVTWNAQTQEITVARHQTVLRLTIGSTVAYVNNAPVTLLLAPTLQNGTTMVPIRFIAEKFGADVLYNEKTHAVLIHKTNTDTRSAVDYTMLLKNSTKSRMGDSFVGGWAMQQSPELVLTERSFDGKTYVFSLKNASGTVTIHVAPNAQNDTAELALADYRSIGNYATVSHLDVEKTPSGVAYAHIQYKTTSSYYTLYADARTYFHNGHKITVELSVNHEIDVTQLGMLQALLDTFDFNFDATCEDLSDVDEQSRTRKYHHAALGISMAIPVDFSEHMSTMNNISFTDGTGQIQISMYSALPEKSCLDWAISDYANNQALFAAKLVEFSDITQTTIAEKTAWMYSYTVNNNGEPRTNYDIFIARDAYFYNIGISLPTEQADPLISSIRFHAIDASSLGTMLRTDAQSDLLFSEASCFDGMLSFQKPRYWKEDLQNVNRFHVADATGHAGIFVHRYARSAYSSLPIFESAVKQELADTAQEFHITKEQKTTFGGNNAYFLQTADNQKHTYVYVFRTSTAYYCVGFSVSPLYDGSHYEEIRNQFFQSVSILK